MYICTHSICMCICLASQEKMIKAGFNVRKFASIEDVAHGRGSEAGMIRVEALIELKISQLEFFEPILLIELRTTVSCRAIRGNSISVNSTLLPS